MDVATMPAGPALDRLVDDRVMGGRSGALAHNLRPYSTDIAHAWAVVEHLRAAGVKWEIADDYRDTGAGSWFAMTERTTGGAAHRVVGPYATTVPLAICRTALLAIEGA